MAVPAFSVYVGPYAKVPHQTLPKGSFTSACSARCSSPLIVEGSSACLGCGSELETIPLKFAPVLPSVLPPSFEGLFTVMPLQSLRVSGQRFTLWTPASGFYQQRYYSPLSEEFQQQILTGASIHLDEIAFLKEFTPVLQWLALNKGCHAEVQSGVVV